MPLREYPHEQGRLQTTRSRSLAKQPGVQHLHLRGNCLILTLPGQPKVIKETLEGICAAVPYCNDLIGGPYLETREEVIKAFRPKSAIKPAATGA